MSDFILFWMAKAVAEILFGLIVVAVFAVVLLVIQHQQDKKRKARKGGQHD